MQDAGGTLLKEKRLTCMSSSFWKIPLSMSGTHWFDFQVITFTFTFILFRLLKSYLRILFRTHLTGIFTARKAQKWTKLFSKLFPSFFKKTDWENLIKNACNLYECRKSLSTVRESTVICMIACRTNVCPLVGLKRKQNIAVGLL